MPTDQSDMLFKENSYYNFVLKENNISSVPLFIPADLAPAKSAKLGGKKARRLREAETSKAYLGTYVYRMPQQQSMAELADKQLPALQSSKLLSEP